MDIWTAQYRYNGDGRLDVTVKGRDRLGMIFAPSWNLVMGVKNGTISEEQYRTSYTEYVNQVLSINPRHATVQQILEKHEYLGKIVLVCFCRTYSFCHRYILADILVEQGWGFYRGELT